MSNSTLAAMLKQYENNTKPAFTSDDKPKYNEKNYFGTFLDDKQNSAIKRVRILPTNDGSSPFVEINTHKAEVEGKDRVFACLKHTKGEDCPFCEAHDILRAGDEAKKELAKKFNVRKMYVVKVIDRDNEADGPKFWRFSHDYRKTGTLDKIFGVLQAVNKDITDPVTGRDLVISIARNQLKIPVIQSINSIDPSPLSEDKAIADEWLSDTRTWESVYSVKPYAYLEILVKGGTPTWDKANDKWVDKESLTETKPSDNLDQELSLGVSNVKSNIVASTTVAPTVNTLVDDSSEEVDDDLPF